MKLTDWEMNILNAEGVEHIGIEDVIVYDGEYATEVMFPKPVIMKNGDLWVVTATFNLNDD